MQTARVPGFVPSTTGFTFANRFPPGVPVTTIPGTPVPWGNDGSRLVVYDDSCLVISPAEGTAAWATDTVQP